MEIFLISLHLLFLAQFLNATLDETTQAVEHSSEINRLQETVDVSTTEKEVEETNNSEDSNTTETPTTVKNTEEPINTELPTELPEYTTETVTENVDAFPEELKSDIWKIWEEEIKEGNNADIIGANPHVYQPDNYLDLSRRFVPQYPYSEIMKHRTSSGASVKEIVPIEAPSEIVEAVSRQSALIESLKPDPVDHSFSKKMLRSGDYWNGVWVEEVNPDTLNTISKPGRAALRASKTKTERSDLGVVKARIMPGNEFYNRVVAMKKISPTLLYIINVNK